MKKLNLGCGDKKIYGFINVDCRKEINPDVIDYIDSLEEFEDESVDLIYACHVLEHIPKEKIKSTLTRWYNILVKGGKIRIAVPDLRALFEYYLNNGNLDEIIGPLYGGQTYTENFHYYGWDEVTMTRDLSNIGFKNIKRYNWNETEHYYVDDFSQSYLPGFEYKMRKQKTFKNKLVSLNMEAIK